MADQEYLRPPRRRSHQAFLSPAMLAVASGTFAAGDTGDFLDASGATVIRFYDNFGPFILSMILVLFCVNCVCLFYLLVAAD